MPIKPITAQQHLAQIIKNKVGVDKTNSNSEQTPKPLANDTITKTVTPIPHYNSTESTLQRAQKRRKLALVRKQNNIESILELAQHYCPPVTSQGEPDPDWIERFLELAEDTSNSNIQKLWAKVLAGEVINPGSFSYKSLITLKHITPKEVDIFQLATSCAGKSSSDGFHQIITGSYLTPSLFNFFNPHKKSYVNLSNAGLNYPDILTLIDTEMIYMQEIESKAFESGESQSLSFANGTLTLTAKCKGCILTYYKFTQTGFSLARLTSNKLSNQYLECLRKALEKSFEVNFANK
ncbi:TIGR03899 family protein [Pseudoalteromonas sp.]|uniref:TIGR03899 family protein n=1 Tax=Pseudoalteromonas sp. TaxID=53249 RepID=UPI0035680504